METKSDLECLDLQITELEMLASMYPKKGEFSVTDPSVVADIRNYVSGLSKFIPKQLDYSLKLEIPDIQDILELNVCLPTNYPDIEPIIYARSSVLSRCEQNKLNNAITEFLTLQHCRGELYVLSLINWLTENASPYFVQEREKRILNEQDDKRQVFFDDTFSRLWIYSHHIYNKDKRRNILALSKDLNLSGFSLPGKPGVICIEGYTKDCDNFFQTVRQMSWKKLSLNHRQIFDLQDTSVEKLRCFQDFQEISFQVRKGPAREYHMDMGEFHKYLELHNCSFAFQHIFGFEGHGSTLSTQD